LKFAEEAKKIMSKPKLKELLDKYKVIKWIAFQELWEMPMRQLSVNWTYLTLMCSVWNRFMPWNFSPHHMFHAMFSPRFLDSQLCKVTWFSWPIRPNDISSLLPCSLPDVSLCWIFCFFNEKSCEFTLSLVWVLR
jgi:hypothetical protein